jgi:hypothetical protein
MSSRCRSLSRPGCHQFQVSGSAQLVFVNVNVVTAVMLGAVTLLIAHDWA